MAEITALSNEQLLSEINALRGAAPAGLGGLSDEEIQSELSTLRGTADQAVASRVVCASGFI